MLLASVRLLMTAPIAFLAGFSFTETLLSVNSGGIAGFLFFYYTSDWIILKNPHKQPRHPGKRFKRLRRILRYRNRVGPWPFILTSPFLSVPVSAFIIRKLYRRSVWILMISLLVLLFWGTLSCLLFSPFSIDQ